MNGQMEHLLLHTCAACLLYSAKTQRLPRNGSSVKKRNITKIVFVCYHYSWLQTTHLVCEIKTSNRNSKINHRPEAGCSFMYQFDARKVQYLSVNRWSGEVRSHDQRIFWWKLLPIADAFSLAPSFPLCFNSFTPSKSSFFSSSVGIPSTSLIAFSTLASLNKTTIKLQYL